MMAGQEELEIEISPEGQVKVHVRGARGKKCLDYVELFRTLLGPVKDQELTQEYYEAETHTHVHQQVQRK